MALERYRKKRDFSRTRERAGVARPRRKRRGELEFVVQKHDASRLHYDFRLEMDGVLKSWAVPKGPSLDPQEKRLAVEVEDDPIEYGGFEGVIPEGEYGGGTVLLWDRGTWSSLEGDPVEAHRKGKLKLELNGEKLRGGWTLVRMHGQRAGDNHENWLLIKENDGTARPGSADEGVRQQAASVASGQTIEEIAADPPRVWRSNREGDGDGKSPRGAKAARGFKGRLQEIARQAAAGGKAPSHGKAAGGPRKKATAKLVRRRRAPAAAAARGGEDLGELAGALPGARRAAMPREVAPELATLVTAPPAGEHWLHEIKFDGYRVLGEVKRGKARLLTRHGKDWTGRFKPVAAAVAALPVESALLDGEVTVLLPDGRSSFQALQESFDAEDGSVPMVYFAFDLLYLDGVDLRGAPLAARKAVLRRLLATAGGPPRQGPLPR